MAKQSRIRIKTPEQIEWIRKSSRLAAATLDMIGQYVKSGISTEELDHICNTFIITNGGISACIHYEGGNKWGKAGYSKYTCISLNDTVCHGTPFTKDILKEWDILNIDVTTILDGYFGDNSRMYAVGKVSKKAHDLINMAQECLEIGIKQVRPGNVFGNIGHEIARYAEKNGYGVVREYGGHGVGVAFHEDPFIYHKAPKNSGDVIQPGMIFTIEPMINAGDHRTVLLKDGWTVKTKDGSLSAQFEHTILVTEDGYEILTVA